MNAAFAADEIDGHDVGMVQSGRRPRLVLETLQLPSVQGGRQRQHLQRHAPAERNLLRLVDDAHAAAAHLADEPETPQGAGHHVANLDIRAMGGRRRRPGHVPQRRGQAVDVLVLGQEPRQVGGELRMAGQERVAVERLTCFDGCQTGGEDFPQWLVARRFDQVHDRPWENFRSLGDFGSLT